jgi:hypothetical protein
VIVGIGVGVGVGVGTTIISGIDSSSGLLIGGAVLIGKTPGGGGKSNLGKSLEASFIK